MNIKSWFIFPTSKYQLYAAIKAILGIIIALELSMLFWGTNIITIIWAILPVGLLPFSQVGETRLQQFGFQLEYGVYTALLISLSAIIITHSQISLSLDLSLAIFFCMALPCFRKSLTGIGGFLGSYVLLVVALHNMTLFAGSNLFLYMKGQLLGFSLGLAIVLILNLLFPLEKISPNDSRGDHYVLIQALRISIAIFIAVTVAQFFKLYNVAWICFAVFAMAKNSLGESLQRATERFIGTLLGVIVGILIAHFMASLVEAFHFVILVFVFFGVYYIKKNYSIGFFFFTLVLAGLFYLFKRPGIDIDHYLLGRLFDTLIGLFIGVCCELLILPRSYLNKLRSNLSIVYRDWWFLMTLIKNPHDVEDLKNLIEDINARVLATENYMQGIRNEPLIMMNRRYRYFKNLPKRLKTLSKVIAKTSLNEMSHATIAFAQEFFGNLRELYSRSEEDRKILFQKYAEILPCLIDRANPNGRQLLVAIDAVLKIYQKMYSVKPYFKTWPS